MSRRIHFVRHGTPIGLHDVYAGITDRPLTEEGRAEARITGRWFAEQGYSGLVYSSPLVRAYDTAWLIADEISKSNESYDGAIRVQDNLIELNVGILEGMRKVDVKTIYGPEAPAWYVDPWNNAFPEGESFLECGLRFSEGIKNILEENKDNDKDIIIAAHRVVIETYFILNGILNYEMDLDNGKTPCSSISTIVYEPDGTIWAERLGWRPE